jgi:hypothetical protein
VRYAVWYGGSADYLAGYAAGKRETLHSLAESLMGQRAD